MKVITISSRISIVSLKKDIYNKVQLVQQTTIMLRKLLQNNVGSEACKYIQNSDEAEKLTYSYTNYERLNEYYSIYEDVHTLEKRLADGLEYFKGKFVDVSDFWRNERRYARLLAPVVEKINVKMKIVDKNAVLLVLTLIIDDEKSDKLEDTDVNYKIEVPSEAYDSEVNIDRYITNNDLKAFLKSAIIH